MSAPLGTRLAWLLPGSALAVATLGWGTASVVDLLAHERHHEHVVYTDAIRILDIETGKGSVHIIGTSDPTITLDATVSEGLRSGGHTEVVEGDRLVVRSTCPEIFSTWCGVDYTIRVPADTAVVADASRSGINVTGVTGDMRLSSSDGGVHVTGASGELELHSGDGSVRGDQLTSDFVTASSSDGGVRLRFTEPPKSVTASSNDGGITIEVPDTPDTYRVDASAGDGSVRTEIRTDPDSPNVIEAHASDGGVRISYPTG